MEKIISDDIRSQQLRQEKEALLIARGEMRKQADLQKQKMMETFEKMKTTGLKSSVSEIIIHTLQSQLHCITDS